VLEPICFSSVKFQSWMYVGACWRGAQDWNDTLLFTGIGAVIAEGSGLTIVGRLDQLVPAVKVVLASILGPGCPSPARPWPTVPGNMMP